MKHIYLAGYVILCMIISGCQKQTTVPRISMQSDHFADSAVQFLRNKLSPDAFAVLNANAPNLIRYKDESIAVRIYPNDTSSRKFILLYKKADRFMAHWVDVLHMSKDNQNKYSGTVSMYDLNNQLTTRYTVKGNNVTDIFDVSKAGTIDTQDGPQTSTSTPDNPEWLDAFVVTPKPLTSIPDYYSAYWLVGREEEFTSFFIPDYNYTGGGVATTSNMEAAPTFPAPKHPIENIKEELKCFTVDNKAVYSVAINVNQPKPNTRDLLNTSSDHEVGHTYLTLQEQLADGSLIIRNIGFYPKNYSKPGNETDRSIFGDDSETPYCVSLKITVSANEFNDIQSAMYSQQSLNYDLEDFNCTTAVINTFYSINISLPTTMRRSKMFTGNDPGDLGQDFRELDLLKFSNLIGGKKVVRTVKNTDSDLPPTRTGACK